MARVRIPIVGSIFLMRDGGIAHIAAEIPDEPYTFIGYEVTPGRNNLEFSWTATGHAIDEGEDGPADLVEWLGEVRDSSHSTREVVATMVCNFGKPYRGFEGGRIAHLVERDWNPTRMFTAIVVHLISGQAIVWEAGPHALPNDG